MNKQTLKVIQNALQSDKELFPLNQTWQYLHQQFNIGRTQGNKLELTLQDKAELLVLVKEATLIDLEKTAIDDFAVMQREEILTVALNEKLAGQAVKKDRLAIKGLTGLALKINSQVYDLPHCGHLDIALQNISTTAHNCILIIENYRCFDRMESLNLNLPVQYADPLVLYRGDNGYSENIVRQLLTALDLPVLVMADLDPKGLLIVQSFANVAGLVAPCLKDLEVLLNDRLKANPDLYAKQLAGCRAALDNSPHYVIRVLWEMMKTHQAGIVQEHWFQNGCKLMLHSLGALKQR
ncbi:MAG: DUF7281 domain-containing protein [Methylococcaceae bacterium]